MTHKHPALLFFLAMVFVAFTTPQALAGMDVSAEKMIRQIEDVDRQLERLRSHPVYEERRRVQTEIERLRSDLSQARDLANRGLTGRGFARANSRPARLLGRIRILEARLRELDREIKGLDEQRRALVESKEQFSRVRNKVAVFTFEDPDGTGLGNALSFLLSKHMLFSTEVGSYAIVNFQSDLSHKGGDGLTYFDKVEKLTRDLGYTIAVWGRIAERGDRLQIDAFVQMPDDKAADRFKRSLTLVDQEQRNLRLTASLTPQRFQVQRWFVSREGASQFQVAAEQLRQLRSFPATTADIVHSLPENQVYRVIESTGDWVHLALDDGQAGWTSVRAFCRDECAQLLTAADFANDLVAFAEGKAPRPLGKGATREALAVHEQMLALTELHDEPQASTKLVNRWLDASPDDRLDPVTEIDRGDGRPPGGAGLENIRAIAELADAGPSLDRERAREIAGELAEASLSDPTNIDVLRNLSALFAYLGDTRRQGIAEEIAASVETDRLPPGQVVR